MDWHRVLSLFLIFAVLGALFAIRARARTDVGTQSRVLRYSSGFRVAGWVGVVGLGLLTLLTSGIGNQGGAAPGWVQAFFGVLCLTSVASLAEFSIRTVRWNDHAIFSTSPWSPTKELRWDETISVTYSEANRWFVFSSSAGMKVTVHSMMDGVAEFLQDARAALPERVYRAALDGFRAHGGLDERFLFGGHGGEGMRVSDLRAFLPESIELAWTDAGRLSQLVEMGVDAGLASDLIPAVARLIVLENESEHSLLVSTNVWMRSGDLPGAERQLERCIQKHGRTGRAVTYEARLFAERGDRERARAGLLEGLRLDPNQGGALSWWLDLEKERGGKAGYVAALEELARSGVAFHADLRLGQHHLDGGRRAEAIALYERALSVAPHEPLVLVTISGALGAAGVFEDVVRLIAPHYDAETSDRYAGSNLALALEKLGRTSEAKAIRAGIPAVGRELEYSDEGAEA